jgi:hypothetical protein
VIRVALFALLLAGCATAPIPPERVTPSMKCADECRQACLVTVPAWMPPNPEDAEAWSFIRPQVVDPMASELRRCEGRRASCVACIDAAIKAGVVKP